MVFCTFLRSRCHNHNTSVRYLEAAVSHMDKVINITLFLPLRSMSVTTAVYMQTLLSVTLGALVLLRKITWSDVDFRRLDSLSESELETSTAYDFFNDMFTFGNIHSSSRTCKQRTNHATPAIDYRLWLTFIRNIIYVMCVSAFYSACRRRVKCPRFCFFFRCRKSAQRSWVIPLAQAAWADLNTAFKLNF